MKKTIKLDFEVRKMLSKINAIEKTFTQEKTDQILQAAANNAVSSIKSRFYEAPNPYTHYFNGGKSKIELNPRAVADAFYSIRTPEKEGPRQIKYKVSVYNNPQSGYLANVAVLLEYGFYNFKGFGVWRKEMRTMKSNIKKMLENQLNSVKNKF